MRPEPAGKSLLKRASFSKAIPRCPASRGVIPRPSAGGADAEKPPETGGFSRTSINRIPPRLEPFGASPAVIPARPAIAVVAMIRIIPVIPVAAAITVAIAIIAIFMVPPAFVAEMRENLEAALLAVVEGLVERVGGIGDTLQHRRRGRPPVSAFAQARHRIVRLLRIICIILLRIHPRIGAIDPHLGEIPHRGLDRRPQLLLIGRQLQARLHGGDPRVGKGRPVLGAHTLMVKPLTMLGIG